jgi:hypothetical protein
MTPPIHKPTKCRRATRRQTQNVAGNCWPCNKISMKGFSPFRRRQSNRQSLPLSLLPAIPLPKSASPALANPQPRRGGMFIAWRRQPQVPSPPRQQKWAIKSHRLRVPEITQASAHAPLDRAPAVGLSLLPSISAAAGSTLRLIQGNDPRRYRSRARSLCFKMNPPLPPKTHPSALNHPQITLSTSQPPPPHATASSLHPSAPD